MQGCDVQLRLVESTLDLCCSNVNKFYPINHPMVLLTKLLEGERMHCKDWSSMMKFG